MLIITYIHRAMHKEIIDLKNEGNYAVLQYDQVQHKVADFFV